MDHLESATATKPVALLGAFVALSVLYVAIKVIHTLFLGPLRHIPGPKITALSRIPQIRHVLAGTTVSNVQALHEKYGDVVRISPTEVSFAGETAWPDIYGFRTGKMKGHLNMRKDPAWYVPPINGAPSIITANEEAHTRARRTLSHAFSEKALAEQGPLIQKYVDQLIGGLKDTTAQSKAPVDMCQWYNWTTFDVIADLLFGEPFYCLQELRTHKYITLLFKGIKFGRLNYIMYYFPYVKYLIPLIMDKTMLSSRQEFYKWIVQQVQKRKDRDTDRPDFMTHILRHNGEGKDATLSDKEIHSNAGILIIAGSETTATLLSGVTYLLLTNRAVYEKLNTEIRSKFKTYSDITIEAVNDTPYLIAVLSEALRYHPPVPTGFERRVGKGGEIVSGYFIPEETAVCASSYPIGHSERNFRDPELFVPERWMGDPKYADDKRHASQPFSYGPRNCLGKNLAYAEMRLILAKMVWTFDMELHPRSRNWLRDCRCMVLWEKPELAVNLKEVVRD